MKIIRLKGKVDADMITFLSKEMSEEGKKVIYLTTSGGSHQEALQLIDMINNHDEEVELVASGYIYSCGLLIFMQATCPKRLVPHTRAMWHQGSIAGLDINELGKIKDDSDRFDLKCHKAFYKSETIKACKELKFTKKEIEKIRKGREVYLEYKRLIKLWPNTL